MTKISASILAANHTFIGRDVEAAEKEGINTFHIDVSDGHYTEKLIFGDQLVSDLRKISSSYLDVHLATYNLPIILGEFIDTGADQITIQYEASEIPLRIISNIKDKGIKAALAFMPTTRYEEMEYYIDEVDVINIMAVFPGIGGQAFSKKVLKKIETAANTVQKHNLSTKISVDGGINIRNAYEIKEAGADILIIGSGIFEGSIADNIKLFKSKLNRGD